jgi:hypothetical protein
MQEATMATNRNHQHRVSQLALAELIEARKHLDRAAETLAGALNSSLRLIAIGEALAAKRLLDEAKDSIDRLEATAEC